MLLLILPACVQGRNALTHRFLGVLEVLETKEDLQGEEEFKDVEKDDETTPGKVLGIVHTLETVVKLGLDRVEDSPCQVASGQDTKDDQNLLLLKMDTLQAVLDVSPLKPMDDAHQDKSCVVNRGNIHMLAV
jgi:hypothetical protein